MPLRPIIQHLIHKTHHHKLIHLFRTKHTLYNHHKATPLCNHHKATPLCNHHKATPLCNHHKTTLPYNHIAIQTTPPYTTTNSHRHTTTHHGPNKQNHKPNTPSVLDSEFDVHPEDQDVGLGMTTTLKCKPPWGEPLPAVSWKKDGVPLKQGSNSRWLLLSNGNLKIRDVRKDDGGVYVCVANTLNIEKDSLPARLTIRGGL